MRAGDIPLKLSRTAKGVSIMKCSADKGDGGERDRVTTVSVRSAASTASSAMDLTLESLEDEAGEEAAES